MARNGTEMIFGGEFWKFENDFALGEGEGTLGLAARFLLLFLARIGQSRH